MMFGRVGRSAVETRTIHVGAVAELLLVLASAALWADLDALQLAQNGYSTYRVVIAQEAPPQVKAVARDFQQVFRVMTGAPIPLATDEQPMGENEILIGPSKHLDELAMYIDWERLGELRAYVYAKLLWDPHFDVEAGMAEYCQHAYGAAADRMLQYVRETQDCSNYFTHDWSKGGYTPVEGFHELGSSHVRPEALTRWSDLLRAAEADVEDDPQALARVRTQSKWHRRYVEQREKAK